jgi:hypothetical protein
MWLVSVAGLAGVMLGGLISFAVSRQQIREARSQRADEAARERRQRSEDRRFKAYADFIISHRSVQNALDFYLKAVGKSNRNDIDTLLQSGYNSSAMVFLVAETARTRKACIEVLRVLEYARDVISDEENLRTEDPWPELNATMGRSMREFQNSAREELDVNGPQWPWVEQQQNELGTYAGPNSTCIKVISARPDPEGYGQTVARDLLPDLRPIQPRGRSRFRAGGARIDLSMEPETCYARSGPSRCLSGDGRGARSGDGPGADLPLGDPVARPGLPPLCALVVVVLPAGAVRQARHRAV